MLRRQVRHAHGRNPSLGRGDRILLDQSVTRSWSSRLRRRQKIDGIKRHVVVDTLGLLVAVLVTAASVQDRAAVPRLLGRARYRCPPGSTICGPSRATPAAWCRP